MKKILSFLLIVAALIFVGCGTAHPVKLNANTDQSGLISGGATVGVNEHVDVGVTGSGTPGTDQWQAGVTVVFRDAPSGDTSVALQAAGARQLDPNHFQLPLEQNRDPHDAGSLALQACIGDPNFESATPAKWLKAPLP